MSYGKLKRSKKIKPKGRKKPMAKRRKRRSTAKRRTYRRRSPVVVVSNPRRRKRRRTYKRKAKKRRVRRNTGLGLKKIKIGDILTNGAIAAGGAAASIVVTNFAATFIAGATKKEITATMKNWLLLVVAAILGVVVPKTKLLKGKNAEVFGIGALSIAAVSIIKNSFGLSKFLTLSGTEEEELDEIISNLQLDGISESSLLGMDIPLMGEDIPLMGGIMESGLSGMAESLEGISDDYDQLEEYE